MAHGNHWGEAVSVFISAKQKAHSHTVISPEEHSSDGWIQMERTFTNISSGTFWNYWCSPFRSIGNVFCIKTMWNGFTYSWNKSRKERNSQSAVKCMACPILTAILTAAQDPQKTEPAQTPARMGCRPPGLSIPHRGATTQMVSGVGSHSLLWLWWLGVSSGQPYSHTRMSNTHKTSWILRNKTHDIGGRYRGAQRSWRWKQWVDKFLLQRTKFSKTNSNEKLLTGLMDFIPPPMLKYSKTCKL